jgi:hypothetical protein
MCDTFFLTLEAEIARFKDRGNIVIMGDLNARTSNKADFVITETYKDDFEPDLNSYNDDILTLPRNNLDAKLNHAGTCLLNLCKTAQLLILNGRTAGNYSGYTTYHCKNGCSTIDYTIVDTDIVNNVLYHNIALPSHISDHCLQSVSIKCNFDNNKKTHNMILQPIPIKFQWSKDAHVTYPISLLQKDSIEKLVTFQHEAFRSNASGVTAATTKLTEIIVSAGRSTLKLIKHKLSCKRKVQKSKKRWFDTECSTMKKTLRHLQKSVRNDPKNPEIRGNFVVISKKYKRLLRNKKQQKRDELLSQLLTLQNTNPKAYWQIIDKLKEGDKDSLSADIEPEEWMNHFKALSTQTFTDSSLENLIKIMEKDANLITLSKPILISEIKSAAKKLKNNKANGDDLIINEMLKYASDILIPALAKLFNLVLTSGTFPITWNISHQTPIFKSGNHFDCNNYRGICISSRLGKLFTGILQNRLADYLDQHQILSPSQAAFRKGYSTTDHIFVLNSLINKYIKNDKKKIYACFIDFSKAYDKVWREGLLYKLLNIGIKGKFYNIIKSMYSDTKCKVKLMEGLTPDFKYDIGIKQGDGLSPVLFNIFINDVCSIFDESSDPLILNNKRISNLLYADDLLLLSQSQTGLQTSLQKLETYCTKWHLEVNTDKSKIMIFSSSGKTPKHTSFSLGTKTIEAVKTYKYLGVIISNTGNFNKNSEILQFKALKAWFKCRSILYSNKVNNVELYLHLFDKLVKPVLLYGVEIWGSAFAGQILKHCNKINDNLFFEKVHNKACKSILGANRNCNNLAARTELGRTPLYPYVWGSLFRYFSKLLNSDKQSLLRYSYESELKSYSEGKHSWLKPICEFFQDHLHWKNNDMWKPRTKSQILAQSRMLILNLKQVYVNFTLQDLNKIRINKQGKLRTYSILKERFELEDYLRADMPRLYRKAITSLRIGLHNLQIEKGRHSTPIIPANERYCPFCPQLVEDEIHFLVKCSLYNDERKIFLEKIKIDGETDIDLYKNILTSTIHPVLFETGKYISTCMAKRAKYLKS